MIGVITNSCCNCMASRAPFSRQGPTRWERLVEDVCPLHYFFETTTQRFLSATADLVLSD